MVVLCLLRPGPKRCCGFPPGLSLLHHSPWVKPPCGEDAQAAPREAHGKELRPPAKKDGHVQSSLQTAVALNDTQTITLESA